MNSITRHLTPKILYTQIKMERQKHKGVFFLMEGSTDFKRFEKFFDKEKVSIVICDGKENVCGTIDISQELGFEDCLGFADLDFDHIDNCCAVNDDIIYSNNHDFDMDICATDVIDRYFNEMALSAKLSAEGGCQSIILSILDALRPLSALRYASVKKNLKYKLSALPIYKFFDGYKIDIDTMIDEVSQGRYNTKDHKDDLRSWITHYSNVNFNSWHFTNGHDLISAIGICLQERIGDRIVPQCKKSEIEKHIRLSFDYADFHACGLAQKIQTWQSARQGLTLLKKVA